MEVNCGLLSGCLLQVYRWVVELPVDAIGLDFCGVPGAAHGCLTAQHIAKYGFPQVRLPRLHVAEHFSRMLLRNIMHTRSNPFKTTSLMNPSLPVTYVAG